MGRQVPARRNRTMFASALIVAGLTAAAVPAEAAKPAEPAPAVVNDMHLVATHGWAAAQPTATGQELVDLHVHEGRLYAGYGDYGANTGPITVASLDLAGGAGFEAETVADTEAVYNLRTINGRLVAPSIDARERADFAISGPWTNVAAVGSTHVFDTTTLTGSDLWMVGSKGPDAAAWRSLDGGATWAEAIRVAPDAGYDGDIARFYFAGVLDGRLYVQAVNGSTGPQATSLVFDGTSWSSGPSLLPTGGWGWRPVPYGQGFLYHRNGHGGWGDVLYFDGTSARAVAYGIDFEVTASGVYVLGTDQTVRSSADLATWNKVAGAPADARSVAVVGGTVFVGTASAQLWSVTIGSATPEEVTVDKTGRDTGRATTRQAGPRSADPRSHRALVAGRP